VKAGDHRGVSVAAASSSAPLRAGVIGAGAMGAHHARAYGLLAGCTLVGVFDPDASRARAAAQPHGARPYMEIEALLEDVDIVTVASPSRLHVEHTLLALHHGCDVLVEKPVAPTAAKARLLQRAVARDPRGPIVAAGHIEHFNPAIRELRKVLEGREILGIDCRRLGPASERNRDIDVVQDLMLHDLHIALDLAGVNPVEVHGAGTTLGSSPTLEYAVATVVFEGGVVGTFGASRATEERVRRMSITATDVHVTVDLAGRTLETCRSTNLTPAAVSGVRQESLVERIHVPSEEPLLAQAAAFVQSCVDRRPPAVGLDIAARCMDLVDDVRACAQPAGARRAIAIAA
jgi:predicted dehydrogenase